MCINCFTLTIPNKSRVAVKGEKMKPKNSFTLLSVNLSQNSESRKTLTNFILPVSLE